MSANRKFHDSEAKFVDHIIRTIFPFVKKWYML